MAITFNGSQMATLSNCTGVSNYPCTLFIRAKSSDNTNNQIIATLIRNTGSYNGLLMWAAGAVGGDPFQVMGTNSTVSYNDGNWHGVVGIGNTSTSQTSNIDNTVTNGTVSITFEGYHEFQVGGRVVSGSPQNYLTGSAACAALWTVALTADECRSLHAGFSPRRVRPQSLLVYGPLIRNLNAWVNNNPTAGNNFSTSATAGNHPRSYGL